MLAPIGISNLGLQILYDLVNRRPDALAERAYAPWVDMEEQIQDAATPYFCAVAHTRAAALQEGTSV